MLASKGEKALYSAVQSNDLVALERVGQEHPDQALVAATLAALLHLNAGNSSRTRELLVWVLANERDPTSDPLYARYVNASFSLNIAAGVTVELEPNRDGLGLLLAELHQDAGDPDAAIAVVEGLEPTSIAAVSLAELYRDADRFDDIVDLTNGVTNDDDATALLCTFRGRAFRALGHTDASRESLKEALKSKKRVAAIRHQALIERALTYLDENKKSLARKEAEKVMAEDSSHPDLPDLLAAIDAK